MCSMKNFKNHSTNFSKTIVIKFEKNILIKTVLSNLYNKNYTYKIF